MSEASVSPKKIPIDDWVKTVKKIDSSKIKDQKEREIFDKIRVHKNIPKTPTRFANFLIHNLKVPASNDKLIKKLWGHIANEIKGVKTHDQVSDKTASKKSKQSNGDKKPKQANSDEKSNQVVADKKSKQNNSDKKQKQVVVDKKQKQVPADKKSKLDKKLAPASNGKSKAAKPAQMEVDVKPVKSPPKKQTVKFQEVKKGNKAPVSKKSTQKQQEEESSDEELGESDGLDEDEDEDEDEELDFDDDSENLDDDDDDDDDLDEDDDDDDDDDDDESD